MQQYLLMNAGYKQSGKPQALYFSKAFLPYPLGFLLFFALAPNPLAHSQGLFSI